MVCFNILIDFLYAMQKNLKEEWLGIEKLDFKP